MFSRKWLVRISAFLLTLTVIATEAFSAELEETQSQPMYVERFSGGLVEANSNRQVHPFSADPVVSPFTIEGFEKIGETSELTIYLNRAEAALRIRNNHTGYLWGGVAIDDAEGLNSAWRCYGNGLVSIECFNEEGVEGRVSIGKDGAAAYEILENGLLCTAVFEKQGISFQVKVTWENSRVSLELVDGSLSEGINGSKYTLKSMSFMPFLGSSYSDCVDGYMLIPDGSGALIRYLKPANYSSTYAARIYGTDYGIASLASTAGNTARPESQILMPIYGMVHGAYQNGFLAVVDQGAEFSSILAAPAQSNNPYNWASARFEIRQKYVKNINREEGTGANVPQEVPNAVIPKISFYFTEGEQANYDGMASMYRQMLIDQGILTPLALENSTVPIQVELLGADQKKNFLWNTTEVFTTAQQAQSIAAQMTSDGIRNLNLVYRCFTKNNECGAGLLSSLGSDSDFLTLQTALEDMGGSMYYYIDPITANKDQITFRTEAANNLSKMEIKWVDNRGSSMYPDTYLYRLTEAEKRVKRANQQAYGGKFALGQMSNKLYSDFTTGKEVTRAESMRHISSMVEMLSDNGKIPMYQPNQYLWQYADGMFDLPTAHSQILYETDCVPFLQIVLSGCVEMYGSPINTSSYSQERLLRQIEYGMAPAFTISGCESTNLYHTAQECYFSTNYGDWQSRIQESYQIVSEGLGKVWGHSIVSHKCVQTGLIQVVYDNGICIYLNYTDQAIRMDGVTVGPRDFCVLGGA